MKCLIAGMILMAASGPLAEVRDPVEVIFWGPQGLEVGRFTEEVDSVLVILLYPWCFGPEKDGSPWYLRYGAPGTAGESQRLEFEPTLAGGGDFGHTINPMICGAFWNGQEPTVNTHIHFWVGGPESHELTVPVIWLNPLPVEQSTWGAIKALHN